ncbi:MAG: serine/threonine protein kinase [Proteobacteria bacterium]|nr:serine/threonine protein kinase [Pseudomonadota bacterium]
MNIGQQISHYMLEEKIGDGGFGDVFRARDINTGMDVAIKCSRADAAETQLKDREQRFMREVSCLSKLRHPGIVQIFEYGTLPEDGTLYLVMEYVCGLTLETLIKRDAPYSFVAASDIILQVLDALAEAHNQGIVHRDLKPANIMLVRQGLRTNVVKLLDFGIAKAFDGTEPDLTSQNFRNGAGFGTPQYMPPEQFYGKKVGPHSDLYAVALVFYELLTGKQAFSGKTLSEIIEKQLKQFPDIPEAFSEGPLGDIFRRALAKQISMRYNSAAEMYADIDAITRYQSPYLARYSNESCAQLPVVTHTPAPPVKSLKLKPKPTPSQNEDEEFDTIAVEFPEAESISNYNTLIFDGQPYTEPSVVSYEDDEDGATSIGISAFPEDLENIRTNDLNTVQPTGYPPPTAPIIGITAHTPDFDSQFQSDEIDIATDAFNRHPELANVQRLGPKPIPRSPNISSINTLMVPSNNLPPEPSDDLPVVFHQQRTSFLPVKGRPAYSPLHRPTILGNDTPLSRLKYRLLMTTPVIRFLNSRFYCWLRHVKHRIGNTIDYLYDRHFTALLVGTCVAILIVAFIIIIMLLP